MKISNYFKIFLGVIIITSCEKQNNWLDVKRNKSDVVPSTLKDLQAILDNDLIMNQGLPGLSLIGSENYYVTLSMWQSRTPVERNAYIWKPDIFEGSTNRDWNQLYQMVEYSNIVLDALNKVSVNSDNNSDWNNAKGSALFYRAFAFYHLASLFAKPYDITTSKSDLGIPLRLSSDINKKTKRSTVQQTYDQIIADLVSAESLLPITPLYQTRPSKPATDGLLARIYLNMGDYENAKTFASNALSNFNVLLDYNSLPNILFPFTAYPGNKEILFWSVAFNYTISSLGYAIADTALFNSYNDNDLRKTKFYYSTGGVHKFQGCYARGAGYFAGIATDELYLIRAESYARLGNSSKALEDLNTLLIKRWKNTIPYIPLTATDANDALNKILAERRKELPFTLPLPWDDLRRLNIDSRFAKTLTRNLNGQIYTLLPNDNKYVYPIPPDEIRMSGLEQNQR